MSDPANSNDQVAAAAEFFGINEWSAGYFHIADNGEVMVSAPVNGHAVDVSLMDIVEGLRQRGLDMPVQLRIENLLDASVANLNECFARAIEQVGYRNQYRGVFPIKVNQQSYMVGEIVRFGERYHHGLEAGSKAELLIAIASLRDPEALIVCNGYKDEEFIDLGLRARQLGLNCVFVVETLAELELIIQRSNALAIEPMIGARLKLSTKVEGHWEKDSGDRSLFGLTTQQVIEVVDRLKAADMLHTLRLLHFHLGSQIPNIRSIRRGINEACRYYVDLVREGAPLGYLDLGGGLAVDYDGSRSSDGNSRNYSLQEYCIDVVEAIFESLEPHGIEHPIIVTESGRATVAYTSILLFNILDVSHFDPECTQPAEDAASQSRILWDVLQTVNADNIQECYNDAIYYRDQAREEFRRGEITLRSRAEAENIYFAVLQKIARLLPHLDRVPTELENLPEQLSDIYYGNFSVFQSLPDSWAINQVFPVMPIHRLNEAPTRKAIIADLTCDCDGKLDLFANPAGTFDTLPLHPLRDGQEYYLGVFLVGAYQETLGDLHNLFGDTNVASVRISREGEINFVYELHGDSIGDVLEYVEYEPGDLFKRFRANAERAVLEKRITVAERQAMLAAFSDSLRGYTYFER